MSAAPAFYYRYLNASAFVCDDEVIRIESGTLVGVSMTPVQSREDSQRSPTCSTEMQLTTWGIRIELLLPGREPLVTHRCPLALWEFVRWRLGIRQDLVGTPDGVLLTDVKLLPDSRDVFPITIKGDTEQSVVEVFEKYPAFWFEISHLRSTLYFTCYRGEPGRMKHLSGPEISLFETPVMFWFHLHELLQLPVWGTHEQAFLI